MLSAQETRAPCKGDLFRLVIAEIRNYRRKREIRARIKRWINVNQIHFAGELGQERGQDIFLVTSDEAIAPLRIMAGRR